jgi:hypothetical protein
MSNFDLMDIDNQLEFTEQYLNDVFPDIFKKFPNLDYGMFVFFNKNVNVFYVVLN